MKKAERKVKKRKPGLKKGKLAEIHLGLHRVQQLTELLHDCGFGNEKYSPVTNMEECADDIRDMLKKLLGDQWWKLRLPKEKTSDGT